MFRLYKRICDWFMNQPWEVKFVLIGCTIHVLIVLILEPRAFIPSRPAPPPVEDIFRLLGL